MREIKRIFLKSMRLLRNKYIVIGCLFVAIILAIGATYSYIRVDLGWRLAGQMKFSELNYSINPSTITSLANSKTVYYNITITSINETNTRYLLTYKSTNADISVKVSSMSLNDASGIIGVYGNNTGVDKTRVVRIGITNNSATEGTVTLSVTGGYTWNRASSVKVPAGYTKVTETIKEEATLMGKTLSELINTKLNCTPTSTMPCLFKQNATENYVTYGGGNWRIVGTYLIGGEYVTKLILKEATNIESTYENISTKLTEFYDGLTNTSVIRAGSPFTCTGTNTISCTGSSNIGLISKSEYDLVGGYNSYMYTLPNKEYWMNTEVGSNVYVGSNKSIKEISKTESKYIRPSIYLIGNTCSKNKGTETNPYEIGVCVNLTVDLDGSTSNIASGKYLSGTVIPLETPTKKNFGFVEWRVTSGNSTITDNELTIGLTDTELDAILERSMVKNYYYVEPSGGEQTWTAPQSGDYLLEVWGAQGGTAVYSDVNYDGGYGGYSRGVVSLDDDETLYINVGGSTTTGAGGYNGGGTGIDLTHAGKGGGGATHIAKNTGLLASFYNANAATFEANKQNILIVAGAGGGGFIYSGYSAKGGCGGGITGTAPRAVGINYTNVSYGTQASAGLSGSFGLGGNGSGNYSRGGGGGGFYGGGSGYLSAGSGGSGYIANLNSGTRSMYAYCEENCTTYESSADATKTTTGTCVSETATPNCAKTGTGYAKITRMISTQSPSLDLVYVTFNDKNGNKIPSMSGYYKKGVTYNDLSDDGYLTIMEVVNGTGYTIDVNKNKITVGSSNGTVKVNRTPYKEFLYKGNEEIYRVPENGNYLVEMWGAEGASHDADNVGGYGGYSRGIISLTQGTPLYINVGGPGSINTSGGYNGGGAYSASTNGGGAGGGATHIATSSGLLSDLSSNTSSVIMVAGGGGGGAKYGTTYKGDGGNGGGYIGGDATGGTANNINASLSRGGGQTQGGTTYALNPTTNTLFGMGTTGSYAGGGGGGWYGGGGAQYSAGAGGSGYIGNANLTNKWMYTYCTGTCLNKASISYATNETINKTKTGTCVSQNPISDCAKTGYGYLKITKINKLGSGTLRTVTLNLNGGSYAFNNGDTYVDTYHQGSTYELVDPTREGYIFLGWTITSGTGYTLDDKNLTIGNTNATITASWVAGKEFSYKGSEEIFTVPESGNYLIEVWGAEGWLQDADNIGGYGGYSRGIISLTEDTPLYINVGGQGIAALIGGYNGGGTGVGNTGVSGGGATHIATSSGLLSDLSSNTSSVIMVAGGGGGGAKYGTTYKGDGGNGGGYIGGDATGGTANNINASLSRGGGQTQGGTTYALNPTTNTLFGMGTTGSYAGGGGGGWYGGGGAQYSAGAGGSGYIGNANLTNKWMYTYCIGTCLNKASISYASTATDTYTQTGTCVNADATESCAKRGNGYAKITFVGN